MGIVASSLLRRNDAKRFKEKEEEYKAPATMPATAKSFKEKEEEYKAPATMPATAKSFSDKAFSHALANNWREAALAFAQQAAYDLELGNEISAASALLRSAKCYTKIQDEDEGTAAARKLALEKALELFVKTNDLGMAATSCEELAELYIEQQELQSALNLFEQAADYCDTSSHNRHSRHCRYETKRIRFVLANKDTYRQWPDHRSQWYEVMATGIMENTNCTRSHDFSS